MSLPNIPNITPEISLNREEAIDLLLASIAMEEIGLSHILNAEGEKLQAFLKTCPEKLCEYLLINDSIHKTLRTIVKSQLLLQLKLEDVVQLDAKYPPKHHECHCDKKSKKGTKCKSCLDKMQKY